MAQQRNHPVVIRLAEFLRLGQPQRLIDRADLENTLRTDCSGHPKEVHAILVALKNGVPAVLLSSSQPGFEDVVVARLAAELHQSEGIRLEVAKWAVTAWALVLGIDYERTARSKAVQRLTDSQAPVEQPPPRITPIPILPDSKPEAVSASFHAGSSNSTNPVAPSAMASPPNNRSLYAATGAVLLSAALLLAAFPGFIPLLNFGSIVPAPQALKSEKAGNIAPPAKPPGDSSGAQEPVTNAPPAGALASDNLVPTAPSLPLQTAGGDDSASAEESDPSEEQHDDAETEDEPIPAPPRETAGELFVSTQDEVSVSVDGKSIGKGRVFRVQLPIGQHRVGFSGERMFIPERVVEIRSGQSRAVTVAKLSEVRLIATPKNCEVWVDGVFYDATPTTLRAPQGVYNVQFRWPAPTPPRDMSLDLRDGLPLVSVVPPK